MEHWYVVHTKPRQEKVAEENLMRQGYPCFLPYGKQWRKCRGKRYLSIEPFFPRYLFVRLDLGATNIAPLRSTLGVQDLVRFGDRIPSVPPAFIEGIKSHSDVEGVVDQEPTDFESGQKVRIEKGTLSGCQAVFLTRNGDERAILLLDMLGRRNWVEVPLSAICSDN